MNNRSKIHRHPLLARTVLVFLLSVVIMLSIVLAGCDGQSKAAGKDPANNTSVASLAEWMPTSSQEEGQLPVGTVVYQAPISDESDSLSEDLPGASAPSCGTPCDVAMQVNHDFIFSGTVLEIDSRTFSYDPRPEERKAFEEEVFGKGKYELRTATLCDITVRIDKVFFGDLFKAGDKVVIYSEDVGKSETISKSKQAVFFTDNLMHEYDGKLYDLRTTSLAGDAPDQKELLDKANVFTSDSLNYSAFPIKDGYVVTPLEWAFDTKPSVALSDGDLYKLAVNLGVPSPPIYPAYYTDKDFAQAIKFYQQKYPKGTGITDPDKWPDTEKKLLELRKQFDFDGKLKKEEEALEKLIKQDEASASSSEKGQVK